MFADHGDNHFSTIDDFNRVKLESVKDVLGSDYVNASYINVSKLISLCYDLHQCEYVNR